MKRFLLLALIVLSSLAVAPRANGGLALVSSSGFAEDCYHEDSFYQRWWYGSMAPGEVFEVALRFCDLATDGNSPGGDGYLAYIEGKNVYVEAVSPSGIVYPGGQLDDKPTEKWARCNGFTGTIWPKGVMAGYEIEAGLWMIRFANLPPRLARDIWVQVHVNWTSTLDNMCPADHIVLEPPVAAQVI